MKPYIKTYLDAAGISVGERIMCEVATLNSREKWER